MKIFPVLPVEEEELVPETDVESNILQNENQ